MQIIESDIIIHAPKDKVWDILMDLKRYGEWNSFTPKVESSLQPGDDVMLHVNMTPGKPLIQQKETILWRKEETSIAWGIPHYFPVRTERAQILTTLENGQTLYRTYDKFWGILVPLVMWLYRKKIQNGFDQMAKDLKKRAESLNQG